MRNAFPSLCLGIAVVLAAVCAWLAVEKAGLERTVGNLQGTLREKETGEEAYRAKIEKLARQKEAFKRRAEMLAADLKTNRLSFTAMASNAGTTNREPAAMALGENLTKRLLDPEARKNLREQKEAFLDTAYAPLFKTMNLSPEETGKLKNMLLDQEIKSAEQMLALAKPGQDLEAQTNVLKEIVQDQSVFDLKLKAVLGDARYAEYQDYNQTIGQRVALDQFSQQLAGAQTSLSDEQGRQLLQIMADEQRGMPGFYNPGDPLAIAETTGLEAMTDERMNDLFSAMQEADQRVLQRAADVLTANQLQALAAFLSAELQSQSAQMAQARLPANPAPGAGATPRAP